MPEHQDTQWLRRHLDASVSPALSTPWILDVDTTIKPIYGHQEGAAGELQGVARAVTHAAQSMLYITPMHAKTNARKQLLVNIRAALRHVSQVAQQFKAQSKPIDRFATFVHYVIDKITQCQMLKLPPAAPQGVG